MKEWKNLDPEIWKSKSISIFESNILQFIQHKPNRVCYCHDPKGIRQKTRLHLGLRHIHEHKFKHSFQDFLNPLSFCHNDIETFTHSLLHYLAYTNGKNDPSGQNWKYELWHFRNKWCSHEKILHYGDNSLSASSNTLTLNSTINYNLLHQKIW